MIKRLLNRFKKDPMFGEIKSRPVPEIEKIIDGLRYRSLDAKCVAQGMTYLAWYWLMQTNRGNFFVVTQSPMLVRPMIQTLDSRDQAISLYYQAAIQEVPFETVFPDVSVKDA